MEKFKKMRGLTLKVAVSLAVLTPAFMAVSALGVKFGLWDWRFGFGTLVRGYGPKLILLTLVVSVLALILALAVKPRKMALVALLALAVPVAAMGIGKNVGKKAGSLPFIHDITTDTQDPPVFSQIIIDQRGADSNSLEYAGAVDPRSKKPVSEAQHEAYPDIQTVEMALAPDAAFDKAEAVLKSLGMKVASADKSTGVLEATASSFWFGFKDDVVVRIRATDGGSRVDIRSVSRVGGSDIGANAARVRAIMGKLTK
jgi:uncharacterized protein (DUF1499 family)